MIESGSQAQKILNEKVTISTCFDRIIYYIINIGRNEPVSCQHAYRVFQVKLWPN